MRLIVGIVLTLTACSMSFASNTLIEGFAKWQADRIERIAVDQALEDIAANTYVKKYFSKTSSSIEFYDSISGQRLIPLMQVYFQEDLNNFDTITLCLKYRFKNHLDNPTSADIDAIATLFKGLQKLVSDNNSKLFTAQDFIKTYCQNVTNKQLKSSRFILTEIQQVSAVKSRVQSKFTLDERALKQALIASFSDKVLSEKQAENVLYFAKRLIQLIEDIETSMGVIENNDNSITYVQKAHHMLLIIDLIGTAAENLLNFEGFNISKLNRLKNISLFLAGLADAANSKDGADQVVAILNQYVNEQDTYNRKRHNTAYLAFVRKNDFTSDKPEKINYISSCRVAQILPCRDTLFLSSYYGLSIMKLDEQSIGDSEWTGRAYGPVGVELKIASYRGSPITLGYAPIDIGNYITAELKGDSYDAKTEDILSPSIFFSWSAASRPFSILVGYQKDIKIDNGLTEDSAFISFAFDLPIATIY
ncbi:hypothetical protein [Pleionea mediterranea]|uniref:Delta endotoxin-like protein n=1 Tax=Pleionea mediterranea TaxID=523701 RepID=A0A316FI38_9GAMM|nr:hypothetical protein [Pleionea mediterranea]PWK47923.1 hypothetical protein C8D97_110138 [Pleionea mediterranea]